MSDTPTTHVPSAQPTTKSQTYNQDPEPLVVFAREFGEVAGKQIGAALAEEIHEDPDVRRAAATGAGVGIGAVVGLGLLAYWLQ